MKASASSGRLKTVARERRIEATDLPAMFSKIRIVGAVDDAAGQ